MMLVAAAPAPLLAQESRIEPVDEASRDLSWAIFRAKLLTAIEKRDRKFVLGVLDPKVRNGSDAPRGIAEFRRQWEVDSDDGVFWRELPSALSVGSAWFERPNKQRELCAPYVLAKWPRDVDPSVYGVISAKEAWVKAEPSWESGTIATLSYHIVRGNRLGSGRPRSQVRAEVGEDPAAQGGHGFRAGGACSQPDRTHRLFRKNRQRLAPHGLRPGSTRLTRVTRGL